MYRFGYNFCRNVFLLSVSILLMLPASAFAKNEKGVFIDLSANLFINSESEFRDAYKSSIFVPEFGIGYFFTDNFYCFGAFELFRVNGKTPQWSMKMEIKQKTFSIGAGYRMQLTDNISICGECAGVSVKYTEALPALKLENDGSCIGIRGRAKLNYSLSRKFDLVFKIGYTYANDTVNGIEKSFGGINTGLGIRYNL